LSPVHLVFWKLEARKKSIWSIRAPCVTRLAKENLWRGGLRSLLVGHIRDKLVHAATHA
jgi:hypothetical protein